MNYIKDNGTVKPDIWSKKNEELLTQEQNEQFTVNPQAQAPVQPIIYIINTDSGFLVGFQGMNNKGIFRKDRRQRGNGGGFFSTVFYFLFGLKRMIKGILVAAVVIAVIVLIANPGLLDKIMVVIFKKIGIYGIIQNIKKLLR